MFLFIQYLEAEILQKSSKNIRWKGNNEFLKIISINPRRLSGGLSENLQNSSINKRFERNLNKIILISF